VDGVGPQAVESPAGREAAPRPFVGRSRELADLSIAIDAARSGAGSLVLVTGEPGIGKTRLIAELAHSAADGGLAVASGRCWEEGGAPPYWPWIQVLRALGGNLDQLAAAAEPRAPLPGGTGGITPEGERIRLFDAVGHFLAHAAADRPLLVTLDDMHAADEPSLLLLRFLA
jgi:predicted ATPase